MRAAPSVVTGLFFMGIFAPWAWFHIAPPPSTDRLSFTVASSIPGWRFDEVPVGSAAQEILATTNLFNGVFVSDRQDRITAFAAEWHAEDSRSMSVVHHTPDLCWVGVGWKPVETGQPRRVELNFEGRQVPFECRCFATPEGLQRELVLWCTLVGGAVLEESDRWRAEESSQTSEVATLRMAWAGRRIGASQFVKNVVARRSATGRKQFVRFSVPLAHDWKEGLDRLQAFAGEWLVLQSSTSSRPN